MKISCRIFPCEEWLYPNSAAGADQIRLYTARASYACCQALLTCDTKNVLLTIKQQGGALPEPEVFEILPVSVNRNSCFLEDLDTDRTTPDEMKQYYTKTAPFQVYDALRPLRDGAVFLKEKTALYLKWRIPAELTPGLYQGTLILLAGETETLLPYRIQVSRATVPAAGRFQMVNWIAPNPAHYHYEPFSPRHWEVLKKLNALACDARQTHVNVNASFFTCDKDNGTYRFQFEHANTYIQMCMKLGCRFIEGPSLKELYLSLCPGAAEDTLCTEPCLEFLSCYLEQWYLFLRRHDYAGITVQHIFDEPREKNITAYQKLGRLVKQKMPGIRTIDAVLTTELDGSPDIVVPTTRFYQLHQDYFDALTKEGRELWLYTCCWPSAPYLNRFLDMPLLSTRYIHWLCYALNIPAYLHWGFCFQAGEQDVFTEPSIPFKIFDDSLEQYLPPGDTNIVYPLEGEPVGSVRLEMQRAGIEDFELLSQLDRSEALALVNRCIRADFTADTALPLFQEIKGALLASLEK